MRSKVVYKGIEVFSKLREPYYQGVAAELGFYFLFSMIPIFTVLAEVLSFFDISLQIATELIQRIASKEIVEGLMSAIDKSPSGGVTIVFIIIALWSASKAQFSLIRIANYSYRFDSKSAVGYIRSRLQAMITIAMLILLIAFSLIILVYGDVILKGAEYIVETILGIAFHFDQMWLYLRWPLGLMIFFVCMLANYTFLTANRVSIKSNIPGAIFASVGMLIASGAYSIYFNKFSNMNAIHGGFAAVIALLLWFYIMSYILVVGILINVVWHECDR